MFYFVSRNVTRPDGRFKVYAGRTVYAYQTYILKCVFFATVREIKESDSPRVQEVKATVELYSLIYYVQSVGLLVLKYILTQLY